MISFDLTEEQKLIVETLRSFAQEKMRPRARSVDEGKLDPKGIYGEAWELGLISSILPEECGGLGGERSAVTGALVAEELAWGDLALAAAILSPTLAVIPLMDFGSPSQKKLLLQRYGAKDFTPGSLALVEPRFDFDPGKPLTAARRHPGGDYVLNGHKCFVPNLGSEPNILVIASEPETVQGFFVDPGANGLKTEGNERNMGLKGFPTAEILLSDCAVPASARLGEEAGMNYALLLDRARVASAALAVGVARAAFEYARDYAK
ncbi:MAG: acyl-CoA dehydrogenase family protein, partial [Vicinamibacteria bacterium]